MDDDFSLSGKIKRFTDVGSTLGGLAIRVIGERVGGFGIDDDAYAKTLKAALGGMKGPFMKVAQFLATIPDALPPEYTKELLELQSNATPMGPLFVKRRMQAELGLNWLEKFRFFDQNSVAAASLGQVHKALHHDGLDLAVKLQYPNMSAIVDADLDQLRLVFSAYRLFNKALDLDSVLNEIKERLFEELDYVNEAHNLSDYRDFFEGNSNVLIPLVYSELSTPRLLTMSWMEGQSILGFCESATQSERDSVGKELFLAWYRPFYLKGLIHGDPHPGNYKINECKQLILLDFGCVRRFESTFVDGVIDLYQALKNKDRDAVVCAYESWGFKNLSNELIDVINGWASMLYEPLLDDRVRPIQSEYSGAKGWKTATDVHAKLNALGGIHVPPEFVFMDRAAVGIGAVLMRLKAEQNWHQLFEDIIQERKLMGINQKQ